MATSGRGRLRLEIDYLPHSVFLVICFNFSFSISLVD